MATPDVRSSDVAARQEAGLSREAFEACVEAAYGAIVNHRSTRRIVASVVAELRNHYELIPLNVREGERIGDADA